jgi:hypothetical protein
MDAQEARACAHLDHALAAGVDLWPECALCVVHLLSEHRPCSILSALVLVGQALDAVQEAGAIQAATAAPAKQVSHQHEDP